METIQRNFNKALTKGEYGEKIVRRVFEQRGFVVYKPVTDGAHAFDALAIKGKRNCIAIDVKAKAMRNKYPDTGINIRHYNLYREFSEKHNMPFWVVFVDEMKAEIYGNTLEQLDIPRTIRGLNYPWNCDHGGGTRYWPVHCMVPIHRLSCDEVLELKQLSQRNHDYETEPDPQILMTEILQPAPLPF
jgi:hypothetical protein